MSGDLTNLQWANRLGKRVRVRTSSSVIEGVVWHLSLRQVVVNNSRLIRNRIIKVTDLPDELQ